MTLNRKYPIGIQTFERVVRGGYLYIDKTDLVWQLAHYAPFVFLSRLLRYRKGDDAAKLPYKLAEIHIGKGVMIGMESLIMSGVTIGDGAIVGAYSLVTKDIPAWTIATGRPAKVVKEIPQRLASDGLGGVKNSYAAIFSFQCFKVA